MIEDLSEFLAKWLINKVNDKRFKLDKFVHGFNIILDTLFIILFSVIISLFIHSLKEVLITIISIAIIRQLTGGHHLKSSESCIVFSTVVLLLVSKIYTVLVPYFYVLNILALITYFLYAPLSFKIDPVIHNKKYYIMKYISIIIVISNIFIFKSQIASVTFFVQAISIIVGKIINKQAGSHD